MKLLTEITHSYQPVVQEATGEGAEKKYYIEGIFLQSEIVNRNGRKYPKDVLKREVDRYRKEHIEKNRALGELGHPDNPTINLDRVSHKIISLTEDGDNFIGKAQILNTPQGNIVKNLIDEGIVFGVSSRGVGSLKEDKDGHHIVDKDFVLVTAADIVADPSAPDAIVTALHEGREWIWSQGRLVESEKQIRRHINSTKDLRGILDYIMTKL